MLLMMRRVLLSLLAAGALVGLTSACDFNAASDALDDFDLIVALPPLATVVNMQAVDATTNDPVPRTVSVAFAGPDAEAVIDIYSDPIASLSFDGGFATFGLDSTRNPSPQSPARVQMRVDADGYEPRIVPLRVTREGAITRAVRLVPSTSDNAPAGTAGERRTVQTGEDGTLQQREEVRTPVVANDPENTQATVTLPQGTRLRTRTGEPLQGAVTADLQVYSTAAEALELLPPAALEASDGTRLQVRGALRIRLQDPSGRRAAQFGAASDAEATTVTATLPALPDGAAPVVTFFDPSTGASETLQLSGAEGLQRGAAKQGVLLSFQLQGNQIVIGGERFDLPELFSNASGGYLSLAGLPARVCTPQGMLTMNRNGQRGAFDVTLRNGGVTGRVTVSDPAASVSLSAADFFDGPIPDVDPLDVTITAPDDQVVTTTASLCSGTSAVTLPATAGTRIDARIVVEPDCPAGEIIPITGEIDGYAVNYRLAGSSDAFRTVAKDDITVVTGGTPERFQTADARLFNVRPGEDYTFIGTFDTGSSQRTLTMPASDGGVITTTDDELNDLCE